MSKKMMKKRKNMYVLGLELGEVRYVYERRKN
jgi:hypothetical protein